MASILSMGCGSPEAGTPQQTGGSGNGAGNGNGGSSTAGSGSGGLSGQGGIAGNGGGTGGSAAGSGGSGPSVVSDDYVSGVSIVVHDEVNTILVVTWTQAIAAESVWLEFTFEDGDILTSHASPGVVGAHRDVVLGTPAETVVTVRVVSRQGGVDYKTTDHMGTTGPLPGGLPVPQILAYDATLASPERWMLASVEDSEGGACESGQYNRWVYWTYIMDRKGRIVWYYADPASLSTSSYQRIAKDGQYIWIEKRSYQQPNAPRSVLKMTLDWEYFEEIEVPLTDCIDITPTGSLLYDANDQLWEMTFPDHQTRSIWSCEEEFSDVNGFQCYTNTINYDAASDTVLMSYPDEDTVVQVDRETGMTVARYGSAPGSYAFAGGVTGFEFNHFPNISAAGTLMVSSHLPGNDTYQPVAGEHAFLEFTIDRVNETLTQTWIYTDGPEWPMYKGMAIRLANGNTLANYGSGGVIREITPDGQTAFHVKFDAPDIDDDFCNKMVGHNEFVEDLYDLNGGPQ